MLNIINKNGRSMSSSLFYSKVVKAIYELFRIDLESGINIEVQLDEDCADIGYIQEVFVDGEQVSKRDIQLCIDDFKCSSELADYIEFDNLYND